MLLLEETRGKLIKAMSELVLERLGVSAEAISEFCRRWSITELALFGSALRRDFREDSDVDVLLTFQQGCDPELRDIVAMEEELQSLFGRKVDLVEKRLIGDNPYRRRNILTYHQVLYPERRPAADIIAEGPRRLDRDLGCVWDMVRAARKIVKITQRDDVDSDLARAAIERHLTTIGETARGLSAEFRSSYPHIPWSDIVAERNILVHNYRGVVEEKIWQIALSAVPALIEQLEPLIAAPPEG